MSHFVLELGVEELPSRFLPSLEKELEIKFTSLLNDAALAYDNIMVMTTPRRAVIHIYGLQTITPVREEIALGPSSRFAFDPEGKPTKAAIGFAKGQHVSLDALFITETPKGSYVAAKKKTGGEKAADILAKAVPDIISGLSFPKRMHWNESLFLFARPLRWILALLDTDIVSLTVGGITSDRFTTGHRVHGKGPFAVESADSFDDILRTKAGVILSPEERRSAIVHGGEKLAAEAGGKILWKDSLLDEVQGLNEHPVPIIGSFHKKFLELPPVVLLTSMETHQKSFGIEDSGGNLLPFFLTVSNLASTSPELVQKGWERVLRARLEDARFYWETDMKSSFDTWSEKLDHVIFLGPLGSMGDKCRRLSSLCQWLLMQTIPNASSAQKSDAALAGKYAKADLVTQMVGEFDTLQGIMGCIYAHKMGLPSPTADALAEQYLPAGPDTPTPNTELGAILSIADKADTLVGCFGLGNIPTGAADPFALRRCALGIARILIDKGIRLSFSALFEKAYSLYKEDIRWKLTKEETLSKLHEFFIGRIKNLFITQKFDTLLVEAAANAGCEDVWSVSQRLTALTKQSNSAGFADSVQTFKRVANIIRKQKNTFSGNYNASLFQEVAEKNFAEKLENLSSEFDELWKNDNFDGLFDLLQGIRPTVDNFFNSTMVMAEDETLRNNRLNLLQALLNKMEMLADFSALQM